MPQTSLLSSMVVYGGPIVVDNPVGDGENGVKYNRDGSLLIST